MSLYKETSTSSGSVTKIFCPIEVNLKVKGKRCRIDWFANSGLSTHYCVIDYWCLKRMRDEMGDWRLETRAGDRRQAWKMGQRTGGNGEKWKALIRDWGQGGKTDLNLLLKDLEMYSIRSIRMHQLLVEVKKYFDLWHDIQEHGTANAPAARGVTKLALSSDWYLHYTFNESRSS